jgi:hypothetical protein
LVLVFFYIFFAFSTFCDLDYRLLELRTWESL